MTAYNVFKNKKVNKSVQSESLLSEVEPLELLLPESEELLLPLRREGPEPPFSEVTKRKTGVTGLSPYQTLFQFNIA